MALRNLTLEMIGVLTEKLRRRRAPNEAHSTIKQPLTECKSAVCVVSWPCALSVIDHDTGYTQQQCSATAANCELGNCISIFSTSWILLVNLSSTETPDVSFAFDLDHIHKCPLDGYVMPLFGSGDCHQSCTSSPPKSRSCLVPF